MVKGINIKVDGKKYPCRSTLGAMLKFKETTGRDVSKIDGDLTDTVTFMWCCVACACEVDNVEFKWDVQQFANRLELSDIEDFNKQFGEQKKTTEAKK
jgi:hypothetical protein